MYPSISFPYTTQYFYVGKSGTEILPTYTTGTFSECISTPPLPSGLMLDQTTCRIHGTPNSAEPLRTYSIIAKDSWGYYSNPGYVTFEVLKLVNLEVPVDMIEVGLSSLSIAMGGSQPTNFPNSQTAIDPNDFDGTSVTYALEIVAANSDSASRQVQLINSETSSVLQSISIPPSQWDPVRIRTGTFSLFSPTVLSLNVGTTSSDGQLKVYSARIIVRQIGASKTSIYFPLVSGPSYLTEGPYAPVFNQTSPTFAGPAVNTGYPTDRFLMTFIKDSYSYSIIPEIGNVWKFEALVSSPSGMSTASVVLRNTTYNTNVSGTLLSTNSTTPELLRTHFATYVPGFDEGAAFQLWSRTSDPGMPIGIHKAGIWIPLNPIRSGQVDHRITRAVELIGGSSQVADLAFQRVAIDLDNYSNSTAAIYSMGSGDGQIALLNCGTMASGADSSNCTATPVHTQGIFTTPGGYVWAFDQISTSSDAMRAGDNYIVRLSNNVGSEIFINSCSINVKFGQ